MSGEANNQDKVTITHLISNRIWGGDVAYAYDLIDTTRENLPNYEVRVITKEVENIKKRFVEQGTHFGVLPLKGVIDPISYVKLSRYIKTGKHIIHVHDFKDAFTAAMAKVISKNRKNIRVVVTRHWVKPAKTDFFSNLTFKNIDKLIFVADLAKRVFESSSPKIDPSKIVVIHNSIKPKQVDMATEDLRSTYGIPADTPIMMMHCRLSPDKGVDVLLTALKDLRKDYHAVIIGNGEKEYLSYLDSLVDQYGLKEKVTFLGFRKDIPNLIPQCDFGLSPSVFREAFSLSVLEYMKYGKAVIATNNGGSVECILEGENGLLIPPKNPEELARALATLIDGKALREEMGKRAKSDYESKYSYDCFWETMSSLYNSLFTQN